MVKLPVHWVLIFNRLSTQKANEKRRLFTSSKAKQVFGLCRWLHIYISCALFSLLLFFCITGVTLNHPEWANTKPANTYTLALPIKFSTVNENDEYPLKQLQRHIELHTGLSNPRSIDLALDLGELTFDYPLPAGYAFVTVILEEQLIEVEHVEGDLLALLNDLHKGRHSGSFWSWIIDISAALMVLFTLTGIVILLQNAKHRRQATYLLLLGSFTPMVIYLLTVPRLIL
ncbi:hypothetical protein HII17_03975 [Thalassotalea sp. M1531]|uniref:Peptidase n=1 Tax=Thalassotalea algicola TaxID=2716224 RepID=A0A7Y0LAN3_9GAMM|nr:PepSY-associated TM helix domain-containing protein [Thalassotalea algicola]NMP30713.1 hypothetical protein [Thalassotalea algicola]